MKVNTRRMITVSSHPKWVKALLDFLQPYKGRVVNHKIFSDIKSGQLTKRQFQGALINFFPLIESFPQYMALNLAKVPHGEGRWNEKTRNWLITNIHQERLHTAWWKDFAEGFGVSTEELNMPICPPPEMDAINNYLWRVSTHGSLAEGISAVNYAIEGPTGEWTKSVRQGFEEYRDVQGVTINKRTLEWITAHASYDDMHPVEALEIVKAYATTEDEQERVKHAAKRSLEYYALALDTCYEKFR